MIPHADAADPALVPVAVVSPVSRTRTYGAAWAWALRTAGIFCARPPSGAPVRGVGVTTSGLCVASSHPTIASYVDGWGWPGHRVMGRRTAAPCMQRCFAALSAGCSCKGSSTDSFRAGHGPRPAGGRSVSAGA